MHTFNNCAGFTEGTLYPLLVIVNKQHWRHASEFPRKGFHLTIKNLYFIFINLSIFCNFSISMLQLNFSQILIQNKRNSLYFFQNNLKLRIGRSSLEEINYDYLNLSLLFEYFPTNNFLSFDFFLLFSEKSHN